MRTRLINPEEEFQRYRRRMEIAGVVVAIMLASQSVTLFGVKEPRIAVEQERTSLRELARVATTRALRGEDLDHADDGAEQAHQRAVV